MATVTSWYFFRVGICAAATTGGDAAQQDVHLVHRDELLNGRHALVALAFVVNDDKLELFSQHAARLVDLVNGKLGGLGALHPAHVAQGPVGAELDDVLRRTPAAASSVRQAMTSNAFLIDNPPSGRQVPPSRPVRSSALLRRGPRISLTTPGRRPRAGPGP